MSKADRRAAPRRPATSVPRHSSRWPLAWLGLLLGLVLATLALAPARWLATGLTWMGSKVPLQLLDARGTIWQGSARLLLTGGAGSRDQALLPERIEWQLGAGWNTLHLDLKALCCMSQPLRLSLQWVDGGAVLNLADHRSLWPAHVLGGLGTPWNTLQPTGQLDLQTQGLHWSARHSQWRGAASLDLQDMGSALSTLRPMGHYRLKLQAAEQTHVTLSTVEGALQLQGQGQWLAGRWRFQGQASTEPALEPALGNVLNIIGRRDGVRSIISIG